MKKIINMSAVVVMMALSGCALWNSIDNATIAYGIGKAITMAYLQEKDNLTPQEQDIAVKVWVAFRDNLDQFKGKEAKEFPDFIKGYARQYLPAGAMQDKACSLVDTYWAAMDKQFGINSLDVPEMVRVLGGLRDGIQSSLPEDKVAKEIIKKALTVKK